MENDDLKLAVEQMKNGKEEGFNAVYSETYNSVYFRARQIMKNEEDAKDLVQIVFVEAYKSITSLESSDKLYSWLYGITYRQGMKIFRKQKEVLLTEEAAELFDTLESEDASTMPELTADQKATSAIIMGIIEELPELQKAALVAYYYDNMKVEQIADVMECSTGTIKSRLNYARKYIKDRIEEKERKEGYRLHAAAWPVLWLAISQLSERTVLTVQAAQEIYNAGCIKLGVSATALHILSAIGEGASAAAVEATGIGAAAVTESAAGVAGAAGAVEAAGVAGAGAATAGTTGVATAATTAATAAGTTGAATVATAALTTKAVIAVVAAASITAAGGATYKAVESYNAAKPAVVEEAVTEAENKTALEETVEKAMEDAEKAPGDVAAGTGTETEAEIETEGAKQETTGEVAEQTPEEALLQENEEETQQDVKTTLSIGTQHQISAFIGSLDNYKQDIFGADAESCLWIIRYYLNDCGTPELVNNIDDMPYEWAKTINDPSNPWALMNVQKEEFNEFFGSGWGIEIPADFNYRAGDEGYWIRITENGYETVTDGSLYQSVGGEVTITDYADGVYTLHGTFQNGAMDDEVLVTKTFTAEAVESGNDDVYDGLTIISYRVE